jgi:hypothetical protein
VCPAPGQSAATLLDRERVDRQPAAALEHNAIDVPSSDTTRSLRRS